MSLHLSKDLAPAIALVALGLGTAPGTAHADEGADPLPSSRPTILFNRWQEDWSVLANPWTPTEPLDGLKYFSLTGPGSNAYMGFGGGVRERFESNDAASFGIGSRASSYSLTRIELDADVHLGPKVQAFVQLQNDVVDGKANPSPVDRDRLDLEQAFVVITQPFSGGTVRIRIGRQQIAFDLQRFVSARDGPNVRQSYDAAWADYEHGPWRMTGFYSQPVQTRDLHPFDDFSSQRLTFGGARMERRLFDSASLAFSVSRFTQDNAIFVSAHGGEWRNVADVRFAGLRRRWDWDVEAMAQTGQVGDQSVRAWALGSLVGYSLEAASWTPRMGLQLDAASGDSNPHDRRLETFNPLFPNGSYVTLAGYTGYVNFVHLKPSITVHPSQTLKLLVAAAAQWRETTQDAVYTQPNIPVANTAGRPGRYTGSYGQLRLDWMATAHCTVALEAVRFVIGDALRNAGGHDADYLSLELKFGW